jgi:acetyl-CoA carboxylase biotin carboxyl carrier protein
MDTKRQYPYDVEAVSNEQSPEHISIEQLRRLVRLIDQSDVSEIEVRRENEGIHLVLRKNIASEASTTEIYQEVAQASEATGALPALENKQQSVVAPLVGIFHPWVKPRGKALVAVGDRVKAGQLVGAIQSLNVIYEVETPVMGRITEILVEDGQPVEYGQPLMTIDSSEEA